MPEADLPVNTIPAWAATIIANVAEIKTRTERLPVIEKELDDMRGRQVPLTEHVTLQNRTDTLWDAWQRSLGSRARDRVWLGILTFVCASLVALQALQNLGVLRHP